MNTKLIGFKPMLIAATVLLSGSAHAATVELLNKKLFDFPDPAAGTRIESRCANWLVTNSVRCRHGWRCRRSTARICTNPTHVRVVLHRRDVHAVVTGPNSVDEGVKAAVQGYLAGCTVTALAAAGAGPQVVAAPATFLGTFKACVMAVSVSGAVGAVLKTVEIKIDASKTHPAPL